MAICKYLGAGGIAGATGQWGAGLGRALGGLGGALGLGAAVDAATRAYTGYGLLETLSVPYIECADGSFATAMEWYGSGLKCPKKPETVPQGSRQGQKPPSAADDYEASILAVGGSVINFLAFHHYQEQFYGTFSPHIVDTRSGHVDKGYNVQIDKLGNVVSYGRLEESYGYAPGVSFLRGTGSSQTFPSPGGTFEHGSLTKSTTNELIMGSMKDLRAVRFYDSNYPNDSSGFFLPPLPNGSYGFLTRSNRYGYDFFGVQATVPNLPIALPAANFPPPAAFTPTPPPPKEDCEEMACPCITPDMIEKAVQKALGLKAFAPEKLIREIGAKIFVAPGPSLTPIVPKDLVEAIAAIVATNYMRAGYGRYPVLMPKSLINDNSAADAVPSEPIENYAEWFEWHLKQQDAIQGEWPIEIAIVDGAKRQPLKFENISEAFVELAGLTIQTATDADACVAVATHAAVTAQKAHTASVIGQKNVECLIRFFGVRTGFKAVFIESAITPMDTDNPAFNLKKFLTPSTQSVAVLTDNDPFDFQAVLDRTLRNSEIAKSAVALDAKTGLVGDYARNQRRYDTAEAKKEAEKELEKLQASINANNPDFKVKIRVDTAAPNDDLVGNNFVIKRPKLTNE